MRPNIMSLFGMDFRIPDVSLMPGHTSPHRKGRTGKHRADLPKIARTAAVVAKTCGHRRAGGIAR